MDLPVDDPNTLTDLQLEVWDDDNFNKDDFLGRCKIPLQMLKKAIHSYGEIQAELSQPLMFFEFFHNNSGSTRVRVSILTLFLFKESVFYKNFPPKNKFLFDNI